MGSQETGERVKRRVHCRSAFILDGGGMGKKKKHDLNKRASHFLGLLLPTSLNIHEPHIIVSSQTKRKGDKASLPLNSQRLFLSPFLVSVRVTQQSPSPFLFFNFSCPLFTPKKTIIFTFSHQRTGARQRQPLIGRAGGCVGGGGEAGG